jgi:hypothetical protein
LRRLLVAAAIALFAVAGCGAPAGKPFHYPLDGVLRLDDVQVKGTHNSYHVETTDIPEWQTSQAPLDVQLDQQGVRQIELDLNWIKDDDGVHYHFEVFHVVLADEGTTCRQFRDCLQTIKGWSDRYPGHLPLYLQMEPKNGFVVELADAFFANLEGDILAVFPRARIITPDEIRGSAATLPAALAASGWPTLAGLRGRVMFNFDNRDEVRLAYTHGGSSLDGRLSFVDSDPTDPFGAISVLNDPVAQHDAIGTALAAHFLVRTRADEDGVQARAGDTSMLDAALASGATFISTDFPAPMNGLAYVVQIPDGTPARCNPVTAPSDCTSLALEDPAFVGSGTR